MRNDRAPTEKHMDKQEIFDKTVADYREVFDDDTPLSAQTVLSDLKSWDSMGQVTFLAKLSKTFSVKFRMKDILKFRTVGDVVDGIAAIMGQ